MSFDAALRALLPVVIPIVAGVVFSRFTGIRTEPMVALLRYVFFPALLFTVLRDGMGFDTFLTVAGVGAAMTAIGLLIANNAHRFLKPRVDSSAAAMNVACFAVPLIALGWSSRGLATSCALFCGATVVLLGVEARRDVRSLFREPWLYAIAAFVLCQRAPVVGTQIEAIVTPMAQAAYPLLLIVLGAALQPAFSWRDGNAWATVCVRMVSGIAVAALAIAILPLSRIVAEGIVLTALAPPATQSMILVGAGKDTEASRSAAAIGTVVSLGIVVTLMLTGWRPWQ